MERCRDIYLIHGSYGNIRIQINYFPAEFTLEKKFQLSVPVICSYFTGWLVVEPTHLKNMLVKLGSSSPNFRGEH